jgi:hypothetical protein
MRTSLTTTANPGANLPDIFQYAGVDRRSLIQITGPDALPALLWLCRQGYESVGYVRSGAPHPAEPIDALIIPHACTADELLSLLDGAPRVRAGGALILHTAQGTGAPDSGAQNKDIETVLERFGYHVAGRFGRGAHAVSVARRGSPLAYAQAA